MKKNIFALLLCALLSSTCLCGCGGTSKKVNSSSQTTTSKTTTNKTTTSKNTKSQTETKKATETSTASSSTSSAAESVPEQNTAQMINYLTKKGRADAKTATDTDVADAVEWLKKNINDYFSDNKHMEDTVYYGALLESRFSGSNNQYERTGWQAQKTIKYVYQGVDSQFDDNTQKNWQKLQTLVKGL